MKKHVRLILVLGLVLGMVGIVSPSIAGQGKVLRMATTTSTDNTGLLDYLKPEFEKATGIELQWISAGTGKALKMGENCDVDVLLVHAPAAELDKLREPLKGLNPDFYTMEIGFRR